MTLEVYTDELFPVPGVNGHHFNIIEKIIKTKSL